MSSPRAAVNNSGWTTRPPWAREQGSTLIEVVMAVSFRRKSWCQPRRSPFPTYLRYSRPGRNPLPTLRAYRVCQLVPWCGRRLFSSPGTALRWASSQQRRCLHIFPPAHSPPCLAVCGCSAAGACRSSAGGPDEPVQGACRGSAVHGAPFAWRDQPPSARVCRRCWSNCSLPSWALTPSATCYGLVS